jgi:hypothetical protein
MNFQFLIAPFRTVTKRQLIFWILVLVIVPMLDYAGFWEVARTESFPNEIMPSSASTWFDFLASVAGLFITFPLILIKFGIAYLIFHTSGVDIFAIAFTDDLAGRLFDAGFDIFICCLCFVVWRVSGHLRRVMAQKRSRAIGMA